MHPAQPFPHAFLVRPQGLLLGVFGVEVNEFPDLTVGLPGRLLLLPMRRADMHGPLPVEVVQRDLYVLDGDGDQRGEADDQHGDADEYKGWPWRLQLGC